MGGLQIVFYIAVLFFVFFVAIKAIKIARMPLHLRWDLYPIPHEKEKGEYGGSYFEEIDWWTKPKDFSLFNELKEMGKEIFFIQSLFRNNRKLWLFSFPFHLGLYLLIGLAALLILSAILNVCGIKAVSSPNAFAGIICSVIPIVGNVAWVLAIVGAFGLLLNRMFDSKLRGASVISDYTNLFILLTFFIVGFIATAKFDSSYVLHRNFVQRLITFNEIPNMNPFLKAEMWIFVVILFYMPFTHMTHFVGKYFTYHKIRWEDHPNIKGSKIEKSIIKALGYNLTWSAPHIKSGGTWAQAATEEAPKNE